ncbi:hypothetical protein ICW40_11935 [Actinotalea ferrariae]|nr:hypothetical protein [Actinotalea ferrariae]
MAVVAGLCAVVGLAACTPEATEPTPTVSPAGTTTPSASPTPTTPPEGIAPERPAELAEVSVAGAEAAARYFLQLYPYVYATGDLTEWRALSHPECTFCASVVSNVEAQVAAGNVNRGSLIDVLEIAAAEITPGRFGVNAVITEAPSRELDPDGNVVSEQPSPITYDAVFALQHLQAGWVVLELDVAEVEES